jgi:hypothetical protein
MASPDIELSPSSTLRSSSPRTACSPSAPAAAPKGLATRRGSIPPPLQMPTFAPPPKAALPRRRVRKAVFAGSPAATEFAFVAPAPVASPDQEVLVPMHLLLPTEPSPPPSVARPAAFVGTGRAPPVPLRVVIAPRAPAPAPVKPARAQLPRRKVRTAPAALEVAAKETVVADGPSPPPSEARRAAVPRRAAPVHLRIVTDFNAPVIPSCGRPQLPRRRTRKTLASPEVPSLQEVVIEEAAVVNEEAVVDEQASVEENVTAVVSEPAPTNSRIATDFRAPVIPSRGRPQLPRRRMRKALASPDGPTVDEAVVEEEAVVPEPEPARGRPQLPRRRIRKALASPEAPAAGEAVFPEPQPVQEAAVKPVENDAAPAPPALLAAVGAARVLEWRPAAGAALRLPRRRVGTKAASIPAISTADVVPVAAISVSAGGSASPTVDIPSVPTDATASAPIGVGAESIPALSGAGAASRPLPRMKRRRAPVFVASSPSVDRTAAVLCAA